MRAFNKLLIASFKQFFRDRTALFFTFAFPIIFMLIFGLVYGGTGNISYNIGVVNQDSSPTGKATVNAFKSVSIFKVKEGSLDDILAQMRGGKLKAVVQIPSTLTDNILAGQATELTVYYDPADSSGQIILQAVRQVTGGLNLSLTQRPDLLVVKEQSVNAHELSGIDFLIPGILAMSILFLGLFGALPMVEWREKGVLKRLGATPLRRSTVIFSQVLYRVVLAFIQTLLIIILARLAFKVDMVGNWAVLFGLVILGTMAFVSIGYLVVSRARTTESAMPIIQLIQFPMLFLSGIFFPIEIMPAFMRPVVNAMPLTYLGDAFRQVMVAATPQQPLWVDVAVLGGWLVVCGLLTTRIFKWD